MLRSLLLQSQPQRVPASHWEEPGQREGGLVGAPSSPKAGRRGEGRKSDQS